MTERPPTLILAGNPNVPATINVILRATRQVREDWRDDMLNFSEGRYDRVLPDDVQSGYRRQTGLTSSIGFGPTLKDASIALRLAKAEVGDSIVGVARRVTSVTTRERAQHQNARPSADSSDRD